MVANNTYLSGFVDNLALVWLANTDGCLDKDGSLLRLMRHNLKKFYAEQLLRYRNTAFARAMLLETLLYEESWMRDVFDRRGSDAELAASHNGVRSLAAALLLNHEIAHVVQKKRSDFRKLLLDDLAVPGIAREWDEMGANLASEYEADAFAIGMTLTQSFEPLRSGDLKRAIAFCFLMFSCMLSLDVSARLTSETMAAEHDADMLDDIHGSMPGAEFVLAHAKHASLRWQSALRILNALCEKEGHSLYSQEGEFPLTQSFVTGVQDLLPEILSGVSPSNRSMCELVARAFHGHEKGFDFLLWRSKQFQFPKGRLPSDNQVLEP